MIVFFEKLSLENIPYLEKSIDISNTVIDWVDGFTFCITHIEKSSLDLIDEVYYVYEFEMENNIEFLEQYRAALINNQNSFTVRIK